jgi:hypothetical protein
LLSNVLISILTFQVGGYVELRSNVTFATPATFFGIFNANGFKVTTTLLTLKGDTHSSLLEVVGQLSLARKGVMVLNANISIVAIVVEIQNETKIQPLAVGELVINGSFVHKGRFEAEEYFKITINGQVDARPGSHLDVTEIRVSDSDLVVLNSGEWIAQRTVLHTNTPDDGLNIIKGHFDSDVHTTAYDLLLIDNTTFSGQLSQETNRVLEVTVIPRKHFFWLPVLQSKPLDLEVKQLSFSFFVPLPLCMPVCLPACF